MKSRLQKELDDLLSFAPPGRLRQSVTQVFFSFLTNTNTNTGLPNNFEETVEDIWFLLNFLEQADSKEEVK